ncbi:chromosome segregation protein SMC [Alicyclobacillus contaminans]|nr:chromosome segregation protein SMC [Alicyclobacillus contaminans]
MFTALHVRNWKNFTRVDIDALAPRMFCVGPNASGKSNLLDVFRFLHDIARTGGGFQNAVRQRGGVSKLRSLAARRYSDIVIEVSMDLRKSRWIYRLAFNQDNNRVPVIREESVWQDGKQILARPDELDKDDPERMTQTQLEQVTANKEFRDIVNFFDSVHYLHIVPQLVREPDRSVGKTYDPFGGDFLEQIMKTQTKTKQSRLRRIESALKVAVPQLEELKVDRDVKGTPHLFGRYAHWRKGAGWQTEDQLSDGTLRLLGLLWAVMDGNGPLLLEEPELSLHPEVVKYIPQMLAIVMRKRSRQIFVSTHSRDLLEDSGIREDEVLMLQPTEEGTDVILGKNDRALTNLLMGEAPLRMWSCQGLARKMWSS